MPQPAAYFERIGFRARPRPDLETLRALHLLHPCAIPFENLSTLTGEPVPLEIDALEDKLIHRRRGGYCFEQNALFKAVLESIGFTVVPLAARVVWNEDRGHVNPRTHMALLVEVSGSRFLCDVGFGGATLTAPLTFETGVVQTTPHEPFRIEQSGGVYVLEVQLGTEWRRAYEFDLQPQQPIDYEAMNHFVATHPSSHFRHHLMAARPDAAGRYALAGNELNRYQGGVAVERRSLRSAGALAEALDRVFGISLTVGPELDAALERIARSAEE
jgi:N-hydroxyarylamine O-acetyltransferase